MLTLIHPVSAFFWFFVDLNILQTIPTSGGGNGMETVISIMVSPVAVVDAESTLQAAAKLMHKKNIGSLVVYRGKEIVGVMKKR